MHHVNFQFLDCHKVERKRRLEGRCKPDPHAWVLWERAICQLPKAEYNALIKAYHFAEKIDYKHTNLSSEIYFAHPLRVASMTITVSSPESRVEAGILGLLHNILELSNINENELIQLFGLSMYKMLQLLLVDRTKQWDQDYKRNYYDQLNAANQLVRIVKIIDKLDNIYLLDLHPDPLIKKLYLGEIHKEIYPLAKKTLPHLWPTIQSVFQDAYIRNIFVLHQI